MILLKSVSLKSEELSGDPFLCAQKGIRDRRSRNPIKKVRHPYVGSDGKHSLF